MKPSSSNRYPTRKGRLKIAGAVFGTGLSVGALAGIVGTEAVRNHDTAVAATNASPWCEITPTLSGISGAETTLGVDSGSTVRIIHKNGEIVDPYTDPASDFGNELQQSDTIAVDHVGKAACNAAGGVSTRRLTNNLQQ